MSPRGGELSLDNNLERLTVRSVSESPVGFENIIELEAVDDQLLGIDLLGLQRFQQRWCAAGVDQSCGKADIAVPQIFEL